MFKFTAGILKYTGAIVIAAGLMITGCAQIKPIDTSTVDTGAADNVESTAVPAPLRTSEVFDTQKYKGLLTVRYLYLDDKVHSGDCIVIQSPDGKTMVIDAGIAGTGSQVVNDLTKLGIDTVDVFVNTHPHPDHIGGLPSVLRNKKVNEVYMENVNVTWDAKSYASAMKMIAEKKIPLHYVADGDQFQLGTDVKVEVLNPKQGEQLKNKNSLNSFSLVLRLTYKNNHFLFTGDIYKDRELQLVKNKKAEIDADVLHAPHHGLPTSSSPDFLDAVSPKIAVFSSNIFVKLSQMEEYRKHNVEVYTTRFNGNILITSDGAQLKVVTEKDYTSDSLKELQNDKNQKYTGD